MRKRCRKNRIVCSIIVVFILVAGWFSFGPNITSNSEASKTVIVGVVSPSTKEANIWKSIAETAKKKYGITIKIRNFTDYSEPNKALKNGEIDLNAFQHYAFLNSWNKANHGGIVAIGKTYIAPNQIYSTKYKKLSELPDGATIVVANDATNESRALFVLKNAGVIDLKKGKKLVSVADITRNPHNYKIKEIAAAQTGRVVSSVDASIVNNDYAGPSGLTSKESIYIEPLNKDSAQWINTLACKKGRENRTLYKQVVKAYQTEKTKKLFKQYYGSSELPAWDIKF